MNKISREEYKALYPFQREAIRFFAQDTEGFPKHLLCVSPTGSGKSRIFETLARESGRKTVLVSPLIALARQQARKLKEQGIPTFLTIGGEYSRPKQGESGVWILSPEGLRKELRSGRLKKWAPNFFVVDECHCFWEWGENFRPAFAKLPKWLEELEIDQSLWLSATLPFDAGRRLKSELPCLAIQGRFALPTKLRLHFEYVEWANRMEELIHWVRERSDLSGLIYVATREQAARISRTLELGLRIRPLLYHGGMSTEERQIVEMLLAEPSKKEPRIVIATSAFGLGMDFSQLKWVLLFQSPSSLLELTQVIGRVARAGQQGEATLFWSNDDFRLLDWKAKDSQRSVDELSKIEKFLRDADCRERGLLAYFNEEPGSFELPRCGRCDRCIVVDNAAAQK